MQVSLPLDMHTEPLKKTQFSARVLFEKKQLGKITQFLKVVVRTHAGRHRSSLKRVSPFWNEMTLSPMKKQSM